MTTAHSRRSRNDHPSCITQRAALALPCARPFYPDRQNRNEATGQITLSWPALSGWPTSPAELERKNAAHLAIPGANPDYADTRENVYADVASDEETYVAGEGPLIQLVNFIQLIDSRGVALLLEVIKAGTWMHGWADDVFFAISLHLSEERVAQLLGCRIGIVRLWFVQAQMAIFREHVKVTAALHPGGRKRMGVSEQDNRWRDTVQAFRERHVAGQDGKWDRLQCCDGGRIEKAFEEATRVGCRQNGERDGNEIG